MDAVSFSSPSPSSARQQGRGGSFARVQRAKLETLRAELEAQLRPLCTRDDLERLPDPADEAQRIGRQATADSLQAVLREQYDAVRLALDALATGSYGTCRACNVPIAPKRLERVPWARLCIQCQELQERQEQQQEEGGLD